MLLLVLVLSPPRRTVLVLDAIHYSYPTHWSASSRERLRSTVGIAAVKTAIEYEYRFTEYRFTEYRFAEYEYDEIRCEARTTMLTEPPPTRLPFRNGPTGASVHHFFVWRLFSKVKRSFADRPKR